MGVVLVTLVLAAVVGRALGGRLGRLDRLPYRGLPLLAGAVGCYLVGWAAPMTGLPAGWTYAPGLAAAGALALAFSVRSRTVYGAGLVGAGLLANALVVALNGGMPVSAGAAARAGVGLPAALADPRLVPAGAGTALRPLGAVIPVPLPLRPEAASVGDLLVLAGLAELLVTGMRPRGWIAPAGPVGARRGRNARAGGVGPDEPVVGPTDRPADQPAPGPAVGPTDRPADQPAPGPAVEPEIEPVVAPAVEPVVGPVVEPAPDKLGMVGHRRGPVTVWRAARPEESTPVPRPRAASNGAGGGHVRLLAPRPPPEDEPLPRAGPT